MRQFHLRRLEDETGISGTGIVTEGYQFQANGICAMRWLSDKSSVAFYASIDDVIAIHGHGGKTVVEWSEDVVDVYTAPEWAHDPISFFKKELMK